MPRLFQGSHEHGFRLLLALAMAVPLLAVAVRPGTTMSRCDRASASGIASTADAVAGQAQAVMETSLLALDLVGDRVLPLSMAENGQSAAVHGFLLSLTAKLPQLESAFVATPDGTSPPPAGCSRGPHSTSANATTTGLAASPRAPCS